jgi:hypothetical protein
VYTDHPFADLGLTLSLPLDRNQHTLLASKSSKGPIVKTIWEGHFLWPFGDSAIRRSITLAIILSGLDCVHYVHDHMSGICQWLLSQIQMQHNSLLPEMQ